MFGQLVIAGVAAIAVLLIAGQLARLRLRRRYRPTGRLVDIGGYRLHIDERGSGDGATVVLEGGTWAPGLAWDAVQDEIAAFARVVAYDRAGLGWSDPSPHPRTAPVMADELRTLLTAADVPGPYVLVGHSFGGTIARVFAHRNQDVTAGVVMLDPAHEDQFRLAPEPLRVFTGQMAARMPVMFRLIGLLVRSGLLALRPSLVPVDLGPVPPETLAAIRARIATEPTVIATMAAEMAQLDHGNDAVRALGIRSLGSVPLEVISHGRAEGVPPQFGPEVAAAYESTWQSLQVTLAALSPRGHRIVAAGVGHNIPTEAPALVVEAVRDVIAATRPATAIAS
jgi:pimeloyl-ACP methyl ester carboxylesterase